MMYIHIYYVYSISKWIYYIISWGYTIELENPLIQWTFVRKIIMGRGFHSYVTNDKRVYIYMVYIYTYVYAI